MTTTTTTVVLNKRGRQFYAALIGFPTNRYFKTYAGAKREASRLARETNGIIKDFVKSKAS